MVLFLSACQYHLVVSTGQWDDKGRRQGIWKSYWDDRNEHLMMKSCFRHGKEIGISRSYLENGKRISVFKFRKNYVKVKFYDSLGKLDMKGKAILQYDADSNLEYFWIGKWKYFDSKHRIIRYVYYEHGKAMAEFIPEKKKRRLRPSPSFDFSATGKKEDE